MVAALPRAGWDVRTVGCVGAADLVWPCASRMPLNQPIPLPDLQAYRSLRTMVRESDVVFIQNFFWPLSSLASEVTWRVGRPALTMVHSNTTSPAGSSALVDLISRVHARSIAARQLRHAPPVAIAHSAVAFIQGTFGLMAPLFPLPLPHLCGSGRDKAWLSEEPMRLVFAGRLVALKNPAAVIEAARRVATRRAVRLDVYGDGPLRKVLESRAPSWVVFHGSRPRDQVLQAVAQAHCFVNASSTDTALTSLLEALCLGVPSISTNVGDASIYLAGELSRLVVAVDDVEAIAVAIDAVADSWPLWRQLSAARGVVLRDIHSEDRSLEVLDSLLVAAMDASKKTTE